MSSSDDAAMSGNKPAAEGKCVIILLVRADRSKKRFRKNIFRILGCSREAELLLMHVSYAFDWSQYVCLTPLRYDLFFFETPKI